MNESLTADLGTELRGIHWGLLPALGFLGWWAVRSGEGFGPAQIMLVLASLMASYDLACRRIPNALTGLTAIAGVGWALLYGGTGGFLQAMASGAIGFGLMLIFYFIGSVGAGDVKAIGALAIFAPSAMGAVILFVCIALAGGLLALLRLVPMSRSLWAFGGLRGLKMAGGDTSLPYGLAIWAGTFVFVLTGGAG